MRVAICDDESKLTEIVKSYVVKTFRENNIEIEIFTYNNSIHLLECVDSLCFDVVFLDINMPNIDGFEVSRKIRISNENIQIIFVTSFETLMHDSFEFRPFDYARKDYLERDLTRAINRFVAYWNKVNIYVSFKNSKECVRWRLSDIYYFESTNIEVIVHKKKEEFIFRGRLIDQEKYVCKHGFIRINRCYLVNWKYVTKMAFPFIFLDGDLKLLVSKRKYAEVENEYIKIRNMQF